MAKWQNGKLANMSCVGYVEDVKSGVSNDVEIIKFKLFDM